MWEKKKKKSGESMEANLNPLLKTSTNQGVRYETRSH